MSQNDTVGMAHHSRPEGAADFSCPDLAALAACAGKSDMGLCTLVHLDGSFSRRLGAQIALDAEGRTFGSLSDNCLEGQLVSEMASAKAAGERRLLRFGAGSPMIDFRLPCGSGLDILVDPFPDRETLQHAVARLEHRHEARIALPLPPGAGPWLLQERRYIPPLNILLFGEGPELLAVRTLATASGFNVRCFTRLGIAGGTLTLDRVPDGLAADAWTAILLLFHDHEWERALLKWALRSDAFYIGAQGGRLARQARTTDLAREGVDEDVIARIRSPVGLIPRARDPQILALSVLAEIAAAYGVLHPHQ